MASLAYFFQDGLLQEKSYDRYNGRINLDSKINKWVSVGLNASAYRGTDRDEFEGFAELLQYVNRIPPTLGIYDKDGNFSYNNLKNPVAHQGRTGLYRRIDQQLNATAYLKQPSFIRVLIEPSKTFDGGRRRNQIATDWTEGRFTESPSAQIPTNTCDPCNRQGNAY